MEVTLLSPISTASARPGDTFLTDVVVPDRLKGAKVEGLVKNPVKAERGFGKGKPNLELEFNTLIFNNQSCAVNGELRDVKNSKGVAHVDEEGRAIGHSSNKKRVAGTVGMAGLGALVGLAAGGGAIAGAAAGGAAGFVLTSKLTTTGTDIALKPGATLTLNVSKPRSDAHRR